MKMYLVVGDYDEDISYGVSYYCILGGIFNTLEEAQQCVARLNQDKSDAPLICQYGGVDEIKEYKLSRKDICIFWSVIPYSGQPVILGGAEYEE